MLDKIQSNDTSLQADMSIVRNDTDTGGKMNGFEATSTFLVNSDPVATKILYIIQCGIHEIYVAVDVDISSESGNTDIGKTVVYLSFYKNK